MHLVDLFEKKNNLCWSSAFHPLSTQIIIFVVVVVVIITTTLLETTLCAGTEPRETSPFLQTNLIEHAKIFTLSELSKYRENACIEDNLQIG